MGATSSKATSWIIATVVVAVAILAGAWFLFVEPLVAEASEVTEQAEDQENKNDAEALQIAALKKQYENIDEYRAELAELRTVIPTRPEHAELQRQLAKLSEEHQVTVTAINVSASSEIVLQSSAPAASDTEDSGADGEATAAAEEEERDVTTETTEAAVGLSGFYLIPMSMELVGGYREVLAFVEDLQTINPRLFLVTSVNGSALGDQEASGGRPATRDGDLGMTVNGQMYVLLDPDAPPIELDLTEPLELPKPPDSKNPMSTK